MSGLREKWAASFQPPKEVWRLEYNEALDLALYVTKEKPIQNVNEDMFGRAPVYHVWNGDDWLYCGGNMREAYNLYTKLSAIET